MSCVPLARCHPLPLAARRSCNALRAWLTLAAATPACLPASPQAQSLLAFRAKDAVLAAEFAALLDGSSTDGLGCSAKDFWGESGPEAPALRLACPFGQPQRDQRNGALVLQRKVSLAPGESVTVPAIYGYEPSTTAKDDRAEAIIARYRGRDLHALFAAQSKVRKDEALHFNVSSTPAVGRETAWNYGAAAAAWSYDDFFDAHMLTQGTAYTYVNGFNSAARDPLQHALPFIFTRPELAADVLRYTLKEMVSTHTTPRYATLDSDWLD